MSKQFTKIDVIFQEVLKCSSIKDKYGLSDRDLNLSLEEGLKPGGKKVIRAIAEIVYRAKTEAVQDSKQLKSSANVIQSIMSKYAP